MCEQVFQRPGSRGEVLYACPLKLNSIHPCFRTSTEFQYRERGAVQNLALKKLVIAARPLKRAADAHLLVIQHLLCMSGDVLSDGTIVIIIPKDVDGLLQSRFGFWFCTRLQPVLYALEACQFPCNFPNYKS